VNLQTSLAVLTSSFGTVTQNGATTNIFYVVSPTQELMIPATGSYPKVMSLSHQ
jgi:hypothetical protein